jgi:hypothetical protein
MPKRWMKVVSRLNVSLPGLVYTARNVANLDARYQACAHVLGAVDRQVNQNSNMPAIESPLLIWPR